MLRCLLIGLLVLSNSLSSHPHSDGREDFEKVNINVAPLSQLIKLPHIGERRAKAIIFLRERKRFTRYTQLLKVKGIGKKTLIKLKKFIEI